jgi:hypothetical protein
MPLQNYNVDPNLNTTISGINIAEGCAPANINNAIRQQMADYAIEGAAMSTLASASTVDIGAANGTITITGTTTIANLGAATAGLRRYVIFAGILTLTYNATTLILPTAASITTAVGDTAEFVSLGSGNWRCTSYQRASGIQVSGSQSFSEVSNQPVMNPDFNIWQRGTSFTFGAGVSGYTADRWRGTSSIVGGVFSRQTDAPTGFLFSIDANAGAGQIAQRIESNISLAYVGKTITVTIAARSISGTAALNAVLSYANATDNFTTITQITSQQLTASLGTSWVELKTTFTALPSQVANGLVVALVPSTTLNYRIAWVKIEDGTGSAGFKPRLFGNELALCQRYYEKSYDVNTTPGTITGAGTCTTIAISTGNINASASFSVQKRVIPSIILFNPVTGGTGTWRDSVGNNGAVATSLGGLLSPGQSRTPILTLGPNFGANISVSGHFTADAEL